MIQPKKFQAPTMCFSYPTKLDKPIKPATTLNRQIEATVETHSKWMTNPNGTTNLHFAKLYEDYAGIAGLHIDSEKPFNAKAECAFYDASPAESLTTAQLS